MIGTRTHLVFYALISYVFIAFFWWFVLLIRINNERFHHQEALLHLRQQTGQLSDAAAQQEFQAHRRERRLQAYMIVGEGSAFLLILTLIAVLAYRSLRKEAQVLNRQKNFLLAVTHELKSPLASIKVSLQTLQRHAHLPADDSRRLQRHALLEADRLEMLVNNLLLAARLDDDHHRIVPERCDLSELVTQCAGTLKAGSGRQHEVVVAAPQPVMVHGDRQALESVVCNLLENAFKYSPPGSQIRVSVSRDGSFAELRVADEGPGIAPDERERIFEKFYRIGQEETRSTKGTGLGLFIVKKMVHLHGGTIRVEENRPRGTIFTVRLPAPEAE